MAEQQKNSVRKMTDWMPDQSTTQSDMVDRGEFMLTSTMKAIQGNRFHMSPVTGICVTRVSHTLHPHLEFG